MLDLQFDLRIAKCQQTIANKLLDLQFDLRIAKRQQLIAVKWTTSLPNIGDARELLTDNSDTTGVLKISTT